MSGILSNFKKQCRKQPGIWRYGFNLKPSLDFMVAGSGTLEGEPGRIVTELNRNGIAISKISDCLGEDSLYPELENAVKSLLRERDDELKELRKRAEDTDAVGEKTFGVQMFGPEIDFDPKSVFARFALQQTLIDIANAYFGMVTKLRYYDVWYTFATDSEARESQLWHFDREDNLILKMFVYLDDVPIEAGPFTYAPQTHRKGALKGADPESFDENGVLRSTDEQMNAVVGKENWIRAVGEKGTIVFADTRGFHKGGEAKEKDRLVYVAMFTSPASVSHRLINFAENTDLTALNKQQIAALEI